MYYECHEKDPDYYAECIRVMDELITPFEEKAGRCNGMVYLLTHYAVCR